MPHLAIVVACLVAFLPSACRRGDETTTPPAPKVTASKPVVHEIVEWDEYTGRLQAIDSVEIRARVSGYLQSVHFSDGALVKKGDLLFVIDPRPYEAVLKQAQSQLDLAHARLDVARSEFERAKRLVKKQAISQEETEARAAAMRV